MLISDIRKNKVHRTLDVIIELSQLAIFKHCKHRVNDVILLIFIEYGVIKLSKVKELMTETDRKHYCPYKPYVDAPQSIGNDVTISAPHMVCCLLAVALFSKCIIRFWPECFCSVLFVYSTRTLWNYLLQSLKMGVKLWMLDLDLVIWQHVWLEPTGKQWILIRVVKKL